MKRTNRGGAHQTFECADDAEAVAAANAAAIAKDAEAKYTMKTEQEKVVAAAVNTHNDRNLSDK